MIEVIHINATKKFFKNKKALDHLNKMIQLAYKKDTKNIRINNDTRNKK